MQTEYAVCMSQLIRQHEEIKIISTHALDLLHSWAEEDYSIQLEQLKNLVERIDWLVSHHTKQEEETIIPLLKEIYGAEEDLSQFIKVEHSHLLTDLSALAETIMGQGQPTNETIHMLTSILQQLLEHKFIEEQALYPLVQTHIDKKKIS